MRHSVHISCPPHYRISGRPPFQQKKKRNRLLALFSTSLLFLLIVSFLANIPPIVPLAHAQTAVDTATGAVTLDQFTTLGNLDTSASHGTFVRPSQIPTTPASSAKSTPQKPLPSAEPAKMKSFAYQLDSSFVRNTPKAQGKASVTASKAAMVINAATVPSGTSPLVAKGSDGRLEIDLPRSSVDLTNATIDGGSAPIGDLSVQVSQNYGHYAAERLFLGSYVIQVVDSQGHIVHGLTLTQPLTIRYHYSTQEIQDMGIDPNNVLLSWPDAISTALTAKTSTDSLTTQMTNDAATQTLTTQATTLGLSTMDVSSESANQAPPKPDTFSVSPNSGQFAYSYPISVAPGPGGFAPQLQLSYSSESTNERYSRRSPAGSAGDGWGISLGSISSEQYPASSTSGAGTWYFISGIDNVSDRLVPDTERGAGWYTTQHIAHLHVFLGSNRCWQVWDPSGAYYTLGCTTNAHSQQYTTDSSGHKQIYQWDLDTYLAPYNNRSQVKQMLITYLQDSPDGGKTIRDSGIQQIQYGLGNTGGTSLTQTGDLLAGTIDFHYHAPSAQGTWADAYGNNYTCSNPPQTTTLRCDDPLTYGSATAPQVMSTLTLDSITSYVGDDSTASHKAYSYALSYQNTPLTNQYWDPLSLIQQDAAGSHLLTQITPTVYQNGTAHARQGSTFGYTGALVV